MTYCMSGCLGGILIPSGGQTLKVCSQSLEEVLPYSALCVSGKHKSITFSSSAIWIWMVISEAVFLVMDAISRPYDTLVFSSYFLLQQHTWYIFDLCAYFPQMYRDIMGLTTSVLHIVIIVITKRSNDFYTLYQFPLMCL